MKKFFLIVLCLFFFDLALAGVSFAATPTPSVSAIPTIPPGPNPAPPIGTPCGNTMCLANETCVKYPTEEDEHCVPTDFDPLDWESVGKDLPQACGNTGVFPPNSTCWNKFKDTQTDMKLYEKTCIYEPIVHYHADRYLHGSAEDQPFDMCGIGEGGPGVSAPGGGNFDCTVGMLVYTDVRDAELGSYGPSIAEEGDKSIDYLAQNYLFNALFARPEDLSEKNREAYRTYWRVLPAANQANLRSFVLNMAHDDLILDIKFDYTDTNGLKKQTTFKNLYDALSKQVILFLHFPFIRLGCLTSYPVCPEYAQATRELKPVFQDLTDLAVKLEIPLATPAIQAYNSAIAAFGGDLDGPYAAITPLDFSGTRGYIVKKKDEAEEEIYNKYDQWLRDTYNAPRYGYDRPKLTNISRESLPYVGATYQGLLSPKFGMLPSFQPQWIVDKYATPSGISDYKLGNLPSDLPEVKIAKRNFLETLKEETAALTSNPLGWISTKIRSFFTPDDQLKGYTKKDVDNDNETIRQAYVNMQYCPLPLSYHLLSPKTVPKSPDDHHQVIYIPGDKLIWNYTPERISLTPEYKCSINNKTKIKTCGWTDPVCPGDDEHYQVGSECFKRKWSVEGIKHGKALTVLNNPKQTDIKEAVAGNDKFSFFKMMLPSGASKVTDASIDAPIAKHFSSDGGAATGPNGTSDILNPGVPINRVNNLAQDSMHILQNCWTVPGDLQNSPRCALVFPPEASVSACTGEAFKKIIGDKDKPSGAADSYFNSFISPNLTPEVITAYAVAEQKTGVPCEVLAGIHFKEGSNKPDQDLQSGAPLGGRSLEESAIQAAEELKGKAGGDITTMNQLIKALSYYNGGGNSNCQAGGSSACAPTDRCGQTVACTVDVTACKCAGGPQAGSCRANCSSGFAYPLSYNYCPPASTGYDDPYVTNLWKSPVHDKMYILYMYDCTQTRPYLDSRPGTLTVAIELFLKEGAGTSNSKNQTAK